MLKSMAAILLSVDKVMLGRFGPVSRICFGTLTMSPLQRDLPPLRGAELILYAYERGIDFVDTAELYGTYPHIGLAVKEVPALKLSTKCYAFDAKTAEQSFRAAVEGVGREYIDLFMLHEQESAHTLRGHAEAIDYFLKKKGQGYIGAIGISTHYVEAVRAAVKYSGIDVIHPILNIRGLGIADGSRQDMENACREAHDAGIGIFAMKPLGGGHLIKERAEAITYLTAAPFVDSVAIGMQCEAEIDCNIALLEGRMPGSSVESAVDGIVRELIIQDWCEGCGRCAARCFQQALAVEGGKARVDSRRCIFCGYCAAECPEFCIKVI